MAGRRGLTVLASVAALAVAHPGWSNPRVHWSFLSCNYGWCYARSHDKVCARGKCTYIDHWHMFKQ